MNSCVIMEEVDPAKSTFQDPIHLPEFGGHNQCILCCPHPVIQSFVWLSVLVHFIKLGGNNNNMVFMYLHSDFHQALVKNITKKR